MARNISDKEAKSTKKQAEKALIEVRDLSKEAGLRLMGLTELSEKVETILTNLNFTVKRQKGSHSQWEGFTKGQRRIVTVDHLKSKTEKYGPKLLSKMIQQSGLTKKEFYSHL